MKQVFLSFILMMLPLAASAYDVEINGIYYNLNRLDKKATVTYGDWNPIRNGGGYSGEVVIPDYIEYEGIQYDVTSIGSSAFKGCSALYYITIPNSITYIGQYSFEDCYALKAVYCHAEEVPSTDQSAFYGCFSIYYDKKTLFVPAIALEKYKKYIPWSSFDRINAGTIVDGIFYTLDTKEMRASVTQKPSSYSGDIVIPESIDDKGTSYSVTEINSSSFKNCKDLTSIIIPNSVELIREDAFHGCESLKSVVIPNSVKTIYSYAFGWCI